MGNSNEAGNEPAKTGKRSIAVTVHIDSTGKASVTPDPVPVPVDQGPVKLEFTLASDTQGYVFESTDAIELQNQFPEVSVTSHEGRKASWTDSATKAGLFPYKIRCRKTSTNELVELSIDPMIRNQA